MEICAAKKDEKVVAPEPVSTEKKEINKNEVLNSLNLNNEYKKVLDDNGMSK